MAVELPVGAAAPPAAVGIVEHSLLAITSTDPAGDCFDQTDILHSSFRGASVNGMSNVKAPTGFGETP